jgi:predicted transcriptional regulator
VRWEYGFTDQILDSFTTEEIGETIFITKSEAEQALNELNKFLL